MALFEVQLLENLMLNQPARPIKKKSAKSPKNETSSSLIGWVLTGAIAVAIAMALAWAAVRTTVYAAERTASNLGSVAATAVSGFFQVAIQSTCHVLEQGNNEQRIQVLNELAEIETGSIDSVPTELLAAVSQNLGHEDPEVRNAARRVMSKLKPVIDRSLVKTIVLN